MANPALPEAAGEVFWRAEVASSIVTLLAPAPRSFQSKVTIETLELSASRRSDDGLHLRLINARQLMILGDPRPDQPLALLLPLDDRAGRRWSSACQALGLQGVIDPLTALQRRRHALALRAFDARREGVTDREITRVLLNAHDLPRGAAWKSDERRAQTLRLLAAGRRYVHGAYLRLLKLECPRRRRG